MKAPFLLSENICVLRYYNRGNLYKSRLTKIAADDTIITEE